MIIMCAKIVIFFKYLQNQANLLFGYFSGRGLQQEPVKYAQCSQIWFAMCPVSRNCKW